MQISRIQLKKLTLRDAACLNDIFSGDVSFRWEERTFFIKLHPLGRMPLETGTRWSVDMEGHSGFWTFWVSPRILLAHARSVLGDDVIGDLLSLPMDLHELVLEVVGEELLENISHALGTEIRRVPENLSESPSTHGVNMEMIHEETGICEARGQLLVDQSGFNVLATRFREVPRINKGWTYQVPVAVALVVGAARLSVGILKDLQPGDIVLVDGEAPWEKNQLILWVPPHQAFRVERRSDGLIMVVAKVEENMADEVKDQKDGEPMVGVDDLEVELRLEVGRKLMTVGELRSLGIGAIVTLETTLERPVSIYANRHFIGTGELVEVEGRLGVRIMEMKDVSSR